MTIPIASGEIPICANSDPFQYLYTGLYLKVHAGVFKIYVNNFSIQKKVPSFTDIFNFVLFHAINSTRF